MVVETRPVRLRLALCPQRLRNRYSQKLALPAESAGWVSAYPAKWAYLRRFGDRPSNWPVKVTRGHHIVEGTDSLVVRF